MHNDTPGTTIVLVLAPYACFALSYSYPLGRHYTGIFTLLMNDPCTWLRRFPPLSHIYRPVHLTSVMKQPDTHLIFLHRLRPEAPLCTRDCRFGSEHLEGGRRPVSCCGRQASCSGACARASPRQESR